MNRLALVLLALFALAAPLAAKDSLGVFSGWAAFRDPAQPRCYAIAKPEPDRRPRELAAYATVASWPTKQIRNQLHIRLSRKLAKGASISLRVGQRSFTLVGGGADAWASDAAMDAAIVAAMRSAARMSVRASDANGRRFSDSYLLAGAATAIDAATLACARKRR
ncbi:MAG: hypothetical protein APF82_09795 [Sphingomonadales bacterium BRH_c42]|nr:MAG: hypothetical protein APF82_09795 [Sphingomonadales bacterium BRH_c42]